MTEEQEQQSPVRNVYITGGTTRYGQVIVRQLTQNGHIVSSPAATSAQANILRDCGALPVYGEEDNASVVRQNLKISGADTIVHLAPLLLNTPPHLRRDWDADVAQIRQQNDALFQAASDAEVPYIVLGSFAFIYEDAPGDTVDEMAPARPADGVPLFEVALEAEQAGAAAIVYTDIERDGAMGGPNLDATVDLAYQLQIPVFVSGGISSEADLREVRQYAEAGLEGVIVGRALYDGRVSIKAGLSALSGASA